MSKKTYTKRALFGSVIALILCCAMLLGTTFAWFTDNASTTVNTINSGTLDVQLLNENGVSLEGTTLGFKYAGENRLWEPGATYELNPFKIKNNGNLALKYKVEITGIGGDAELNDVIDWNLVVNGQKFDLDDINDLILKPNETSSLITIVGHMQEEAGNDYMGKSIDNIAITVYATQATVEHDSYNNQYDKDAKYAVADGVYKENGELVVYSTSGLSSVATLAQTDSSLTSVAYVTDTGKVEVPIVSSSNDIDKAIEDNNKIIVLAGNSSVTLDKGQNTSLTIVGDGSSKIVLENNELPSGSGDFCFQGSNVVLENMVIETTNKDWDGFQNAKNITLNNCTINGNLFLSGNATFNNCVFNVASNANKYNVWAYSSNYGHYTAEFNGCTFNCAGKSIYVDGNGNNGITVNFNSCTFNDTGDDTVVNDKAAIETGTTYGKTYEIIISNSIFNGFTVNPTGTSTNSPIWANKHSMTADMLNVTIDGVEVF